MIKSSIEKRQYGLKLIAIFLSISLSLSQTPAYAARQEVIFSKSELRSLVPKIARLVEAELPLSEMRGGAVAMAMLQRQHQVRYEQQKKMPIAAWLDDIDGNIADGNGQVPDDIIEEYVADAMKGIIRAFVTGRPEFSSEEITRAGTHSVQEVYDRVIEKLNTPERRRFIPNVLAFPEDASHVSWKEWDSAKRQLVRYEIDLMKHYVDPSFSLDHDQQTVFYDQVVEHLSQSGIQNPFKQLLRKRHAIGGVVVPSSETMVDDAYTEYVKRIAREIESFLESSDEYQRFTVLVSGDGIAIVPKGLDKILAVRFIKDHFGLRDNQIASFDDRGALKGNGHDVTNRVHGYSTYSYDARSREQVALRLIYGELKGVEARRRARDELTVQAGALEQFNPAMNLAEAFDKLDKGDATDQQIMRHLMKAADQFAQADSGITDPDLLKHHLARVFTRESGAGLQNIHMVEFIRRSFTNSPEAPLVLVGNTLSLNPDYVEPGWEFHQHRANTREVIEKAMREGADGLEIDVQMVFSAEKRRKIPILFHDLTKKTLEDLRSDQPDVLTLDEFVEILGVKNLKLQVDLKGLLWLSDEHLRLLEQSFKSVSYSSIHTELLTVLQRRWPDAQPVFHLVGMETLLELREFKRKGIGTVNLSLRDVHPDILQRIATAGLEVQFGGDSSMLEPNKHLIKSGVLVVDDVDTTRDMVLAMSELRESAIDRLVIRPQVSTEPMEEKERKQAQNLGERQRAALDRLLRAIQDAIEDMHIVDLILHDERVEIPKYFYEVIREGKFFLYFSKMFRWPVIAGVDDLLKYVDEPTKLDFVIKYAVEFLFHEFGHIVDRNGGIMIKDEARLENMRQGIVEKYGLNAGEKEVLRHALGDLRAERFRFDAPSDARSVTTYGEGRFRSLYGSSHNRATLDSRVVIIAETAYAPIWHYLGPEDREGEADSVMLSEIVDDHKDFYRDLKAFFMDYFANLEYDPSWVDRLKGDPRLVERDQELILPFRNALFKDEFLESGTYIYTAALSEARSLNIEDVSQNAGVILDGTELERFGEDASAGVLEELLVMRSEQRNFGIYIEGEVDLSEHSNAVVRAIAAVSSGVPTPDRIRGKQVLVRVHLDESGGNELSGDYRSALVVPVLGEAGAVTVMLHAAQSALIAASEIRKLDETVLSRFARKENGIWQVHQDYLHQAQSEIRAAYAVAIAA